MRRTAGGGAATLTAPRPLAWSPGSVQLLPLVLLTVTVLCPRPAAAACPDPAALLDTLELATMDGRFDAADDASDALVAAFGCGGPADKELVARMWLSRAVLAAARGDDAAADDALTAAARTSPGTWNEMYGPTLRARWEEAASRPAPPGGHLRLDPLPAGAVSAVDGEVVPLPAALAAGLHLLQVGPRPSAPRTFAAATVFYLPSGLELSLDPGLPEAPPPARTPSRRVRRLVPAAIVGGLALAVYGASAATHAAFYGQPEGGGDRSAARQRVNNGLVLGSVGLGVASGVLVIRAAATPP